MNRDMGKVGVSMLNCDTKNSLNQLQEIFDRSEIEEKQELVGMLEKYGNRVIHNYALGLYSVLCYIADVIFKQEVKMEKQVKFVDLFAGIGGIRKGEVKEQTGELLTSKGVSWSAANWYEANYDHTAWAFGWCHRKSRWK